MNAQLSDHPTDSLPASSPIPSLCRRSTDSLTLLPTSATSKFSSLQSNLAKETYRSDVIALTRIGWNLSSIAKHVSSVINKPTTQTLFLVKAVIGDSQAKALSFTRLLPHLPLHKFVDPTYLDEFASSLARLTNPERPKQPLSDYDVHILKILVLMGWKKRRVADLLQVSPTMVTIYTSSHTPWTYDELKELLPTLFQGSNNERSEVLSNDSNNEASK